MTHMTQPTPSSVLPVIDTRLIATILLAGAAADLAWEVWARGVTPFLVGGPLEPAALVQTVFGLQSRLPAEIIHLVVGVVFYPIGWLFIARPLQRLLLPRLPRLLAGIGFGIGLWIFALYVMAHLIGGLPAFLGFVPLAYASLAGHVLFGVIVAEVVNWRESNV